MQVSGWTHHLVHLSSVKHLSRNIPSHHPESPHHHAPLSPHGYFRQNPGTLGTRIAAEWMLTPQVRGNLTWPIPSPWYRHTSFRKRLEAPAVPFLRLLRLLRRQRAGRAGPPLVAALQHRAACAGHGGGTGTWGALLAGPGAWMACAGDARAGRYGLRNGRNQWKDVSRCWLLQIYIYIYIIYII